MNELIIPLLISFAAAAGLGPILIPLLKRLKFGQVVRDDGPQSHLSKSGVPTMGGFLIIIGAIIGIAVTYGKFDYKAYLFIVALLLYMGVGFIDDFIKVVLKRSKGLSAKMKAALLLVISVGIGYFVYKYVGTDIKLPFTDKTWDIGWWIIPLSTLVLVSTTNSANLTDGQDGLLSGIAMAYFFAYALAFVFMPDIFESGLATLSVGVVGACLGFLVFNAYPARCFMGDTGSLAIGGAMGMIALLSKTLIWVPFMGLTIVVASVSVIIQVGYYKKTKKRVFKMAPLHHHFEQLGYPEMKITAIYVIVTTVMSLIGILAIK